MWVEASLVVPRAARLAAIEALERLGCAALEERELGRHGAIADPGGAPVAAGGADRVRLGAWFEDPDRVGIEHALAQVLSEAGAEAPVTWRDVGDVDWAQAWKEEHRPLSVSPRLVIAPPWDAPAGAVLIEPGQGFGTGWHPTTRNALRALDALADEVRTVLDVGCGSGVLALAAARLGCAARGIDVDAGAVAEARANAARNGLDVPFATGSVTTERQPADLVLANVHAELALELGAALVAVTGRWLVLSGLLADRVPDVRAWFDRRLRLEREDEGEGAWRCLWYRAA